MLRRKGKNKTYIENVTDKDFPPKTGIFFFHTGNEDYEECIVKVIGGDYTVTTIDGTVHQLDDFNTLDKKWVETSDPSKNPSNISIQEAGYDVVDNIQELSIPGTYFLKYEDNTLKECLLYKSKDGVKISFVEGDSLDLDKLNIKEAEWIKSSIPNKAPKRKDVRRPNKQQKTHNHNLSDSYQTSMSNENERQRQLHEFLQSKGNVASSDDDNQFERKNKRNRNNRFNR